ncbi:putative protein [Arabidopsis thaliana]|nr:putative protein [Arabidopsis thaliana]CAB80135.1 putative protein [Arabidopsis thaliana]
MTRSVSFPLFLFAVVLSLSSSLLADDPKPIRREVYEGGKIYDISHRYTPEIPAWESSEGLGKTFLRLAASMKNGSFANVSEMKLSVHSGTHVDAPGHFWDNYYDAGFDTDSLDLQVLNGPALLVDVPRDKNITAEVMESLHIQRGVRRVLFRTSNTDNLYYTFFSETGYSALWNPGLDYLSFAAFEESPATHRVILKGRRYSLDKKVREIGRLKREMNYVLTREIHMFSGYNPSGSAEAGWCGGRNILASLLTAEISWSGRSTDKMHSHQVIQGKRKHNLCVLVVFHYIERDMQVPSSLQKASVLSTKEKPLNAQESVLVVHQLNDNRSEPALLTTKIRLLDVAKRIAKEKS